MRSKALLLSFLLCLFSASTFATLNVGILTFDPPYVYSPSEGFDIDLTRDICAGLKTKCNLIFMNFNQFFSGLDNGKIDFALGGIFIDPTSQYIFSLPYIVGRGQFMTLKNSPYHTIADLKGTTVGVIKGNPAGNFFADFLANTYPGMFHAKDYDNVNDIVTALNNNLISAAFIRRSSVRYWTLNDLAFRELGPVHQIGTGIGIMSTPQHAALIMQINQVILNMESDNSYITLYNTYFYNNK